MIAVILAGGMGSRISEETVLRPKPMIEIGNKPVLWHIMKIYSAYGVNDFVICLGYKGYMIKEYFANYLLHMSDVTFDLRGAGMDIHQSSHAEPWRVTLIDTGDATMTGGRVKRAIEYVGDEDFFLTYGDGVADVDIGALRDFHRREGRLATVTAVQPLGRFGMLIREGPRVEAFQEKPQGDGGWVNGGFFVLSPRASEYIDGDEAIWEQEPLQRLARDGQLSAYEHPGFWHSMDTMWDRNYLQDLWEAGDAPWKVWT